MTGGQTNKVNAGWHPVQVERDQVFALGKVLVQRTDHPSRTVRYFNGQFLTAFCIVGYGERSVSRIGIYGPVVFTGLTRS